MKKQNNELSALILAVIIALLLFGSSCATTKKDCRGVKHYKQSGGFYL